MLRRAFWEGQRNKFYELNSAIQLQKQFFCLSHALNCSFRCFELYFKKFLSPATLHVMHILRGTELVNPIQKRILNSDYFSSDGLGNESSILLCWNAVFKCTHLHALLDQHEKFGVRKEGLGQRGARLTTSILHLETVL